MFGIILLSPILRLLHLLSITFAPFMLGKLLRIVHSFQRPEISTIKNLQLNVATTKTETMKDLKKHGFIRQKKVRISTLVLVYKDQLCL